MIQQSKKNLMNNKNTLHFITQLFLVFILLPNQMNAERNFTSGPTITNFIGADTIDNFAPACGSTTATFEITAEDNCNNPSLLEYNWEFSNGLFGTGNSASGVFLNGNYSLTFTINDQCGDSILYIHDFIVKDAKLPTPVCMVGIPTVLMPSSGSVTVWASNFQSGNSSDNCTAYDDLKFSFSPDENMVSLTINCTDIPADGLFPISLYVTDEAGNQDFCSTLVSIQDPNGVCCSSCYPSVFGKVENENQEGIEEVTVSLNTGGSMNPSPINTGADGLYNFNIWPTEGYIVTPKKDINYLNGVTTYDLVLISKHILGTQLLDSPYKMIAADANNSKSITTLDIVKLRALILHIDDELEYNESWRFVNAYYSFPNPNNPWHEEFPETHQFVNYVGIYDPGNFVAIKIGDVNGTASPNSLLGSDVRTFAGKITIHLQNKKITKEEKFTVDFRAEDFKNIEGYQFTLGFEKEVVEFVEVIPNLEGLEEGNFGLTKLEEGKITTSWNSSEGIDLEKNAILFSMTFKAKSAGETANIFKINSHYTTAEAYSGNDLFEVEISNDSVRNTTFANDFELYQNAPNPFRNETTISFYLPKSEIVILKIYDLSGRVLNQMELEGKEGFNSKKIRVDFAATGVLYYQLETATETAIKKMILVD